MNYTKYTILYIYFTDIYDLIFSNLESPIPLTFFKSLIDLNLPFWFLYSIIFRAVEGPIPGIVSSSVWVAELIFINSVFFAIFELSE